ncbi:MAG: ABC transporter substrate-binding protein [Dehalococcoidia bacterium]
MSTNSYWNRKRVPVTRRQLLRGAGVTRTGAGSALLFGCGGDDDPGDVASPAAAGELGPPEVTELRLPKCSATCGAPFLAAKDYFRDEGFTSVTFLPCEPQLLDATLVSGGLDIVMNFTPQLAFDMAGGMPLVAIGGAHASCFELIALDPAIQAISDLRGHTSTMIVREPTGADFAFVRSIFHHIGLKPGVDVEVVSHLSFDQALRDLRSGKVATAFVNPPLTQSFRDGAGTHILLDSLTDRPWSQYFCCQFVTSKQFLAENPIATRRALRALLRGVDRCYREPDVVASEMAAAGWVAVDRYAREMLATIPYDAWRSHSPEDAMRFYALQLRELGDINLTPDDLIAKNSDFRFFNELKKRLAFAPGLAPRGGFALNCDIQAGPMGPAVPS